MGLMRDVWGFMKKEKKWWLLPLIVVLVLLGVLLFVVEGSTIAPFIYTLF